jgi:hypothetical protein
MARKIRKITASLSGISKDDLVKMRAENRIDDGRGSDCIAVANSEASSGNLDVNLVATVPHNSVVSSVAYSRNGYFIATGCNKTAQIFDANTGILLNTFVLEEGPKDNYCRDICFSADGGSLMTAEESKLIRVCSTSNARLLKGSRYLGSQQWLTGALTLQLPRYGILRQGQRSGPLPAMKGMFSHWISALTEIPLLLAAVTTQHDFGHIQQAQRLQYYVPQAQREQSSPEMTNMDSAVSPYPKTRDMWPRLHPICSATFGTYRTTTLFGKARTMTTGTKNLFTVSSTISML